MPISREQCRTQLLATFQAELTCAARLQNLLAQETEALEARDSVAMECLIADKHTIMQDFERLETQRGEILKTAGFADHQIDLCISRCDRDGQLKLVWQQLLDRVRDCQHSNRKIGATVEVSRRYVQQALGVLRGQSPQADLYTASGASNTPFAATRTLGKV